ncbi:MAG: S1 RNA-binding domain-containing protein [Patescibacteria group bacterium]
MIADSKNAKPILNQIFKVSSVNLGGPKEGDVVEAILIKKTTRNVFFDIESFGTGVLYGTELSNAKSAIRDLEPGGKIAAKIVNLEGENGYIELSLSEADKQQLWQQAKELMESGEIVKTKITGSNSGGLTLNLLNLKAFLPVSQLSNDHQPKQTDGDKQKISEELKKLIGEELGVKVIDVNPRNNKLIVSERETSSVNVKELLTGYQIGQEIEGMVSGIADFGVFIKFVDNPSIEGMIHISELDHKLIDNPKEVVKINDSVRVKIIDIRDNRVILSLKALKADPWERASEMYKSGQEVSGKVYKFNPFGAVVSLGEGELQGMIHVSKFGSLEEMKKELEISHEYNFTIESVNPQEKRIILDLKK